MPAKAQTSMQVVRKENKEARLRDFIQAAIDRADRADPSAPREMLLVARSVESPVLKAIAGLASQIASLGWTMRAVVMRTDGIGYGAAVAPDLGNLPATFRHAANARLAEAHEQLVLPDAAAWVGDCMRRDPSQRDAFELFEAAPGSTALWAMRSFERIWLHGEELKACPPVSLLATVIAGGMAQVAATAAEAGSGSSVLTRH